MEESKRVERKKKLLKPRSWIWNYITRLSNKSAVCNLCSKRYETSGNTSNLGFHLLKKHSLYKGVRVKPPEKIPKLSILKQTYPIIRIPGNASNLELLTGLSATKKFIIVKQPENSSLPPNTSSIPCPETNLLKDTHAETDDRYQAITEAMALMIAKDLQPFTMVQNFGFNEFMKVLHPDYIIPHPDYFSDIMLPQLFCKGVSILKEHLKSVKHVAISFERWTSMDLQFYINVVCHFLHGEKPVSALLNVLIIEAQDAIINLADVMLPILDDWGLTRKIVAGLDDCKGTMSPTLRTLSIDVLPCFGHTLNQIIQDCLCEESIFEEDTSMLQGQAFEDELPDLEQAYLLQESAIKSLLKKCHNIVQFIRRNRISMNVICKSEGLEAVTWDFKDISSRWSSTYTILQRLEEIRPQVAKFLEHFADAPAALTQEEFDIIEDVTQLLKPFVEATEKFSSEPYPMSSLIVPVVHGLELVLKNLVVSTPVGLKLQSRLKQEMYKRLTQYEINILTSSSAMLDPRFKQRAFLSAHNADAARQQLESMVSLLLIEAEMTPLQKAVEICCSSGQNEANGLVEENQGDGLLSFLNNSRPDPLVSSTAAASVQIDKYLCSPIEGNDTDSFTYWQEHKNVFPELTALAGKYLCVPAISIPSDNLFCSPRNAVSEMRSRLDSKGIDQLLFIHHNFWLYSK